MAQILELVSQIILYTSTFSNSKQIIYNHK